MACSNADFGQILIANGVNSLLNTLVYGERKFLVWTRVSLDSRTWIINTSDGVTVWKLELDKDHIESYRELLQVDSCEAFLTKIRSDFHLGQLMISAETSKVVLIVGVAESVIRLDLYEASDDDRKNELQHLILWMSDNITTLTDKLKVMTDTLDREKNAKEANTCDPGTLDLQPKQLQSTTGKRKPSYCVVSTGNQNLPLELNTVPDNQETTVHLSVLYGSQMLDVFRCPDPSRCHFPCKSNRRYHCPLCDNKPQKPGRMRRHFFTMHAGKHVIEHDGYRMLRCKLKCTRANGRIADSSHYHCCLCGRVCLRKVHLCCHLQAHALGTSKDVEDEIMDASKTEEEQEEDEQEEDDEAEDETAEQTVLQTSQISCSVDDPDQNMVTLADGTQVVYVQSMENGETLTVVPVSSQSNTSQLGTTDQLNPSLQVLASTQPNTHMQGLNTIAHDGEEQDLETILQNERNSDVPNAPSSTSTSTVMPTFHTYTSQEPQRQIGFHQSYNELSNDQSGPTNTGLDVYEGTSDPNRLKTSNLPNVACGLTTQQAIDLSAVNSSLDINALVSATPVAASGVGTQQTSAVSTPVNSQGMQGTNQLRNEPLNNQQTTKTPDNDSLMLLKCDQDIQGDDSVFNKLFSETKPRTGEIFQHPSVIPEKTNLQVPRCKNTECDCRLYHCPLCTCLPNKPGRIREHFRKMHSENLIIRYQGYQMLRCKLGCCRSTGKRILNSHYHCCLCGYICISKSGVYEHMRTQHTDRVLKSESSLNAEKRKSTTAVSTPSIKRQAIEENHSTADCKPDENGPRAPLVVQIPSLGSKQNTRLQGNQSLDAQSGEMASHDSMNTSNQQQQQQPVVIVMPQQMQNYTQGQNQQPIVIVMPQGGSGGAVQMAQPYVVSMPQQTNN